MKKIAIALVAAVLVSGCATKEYVDEQIAKASQTGNQRMDAQQSEMSGKLGKMADETNSRQILLDGKLNTLQGSVDSIGRTAQEALGRAIAAGKLAEGKFVYETVLSSQVAFTLNSSVLSKDGKKALDALAGKLKSDNKNVYLEIQGYTDSSGSEAVNLRISQARAEAVYRYLAIQCGIPLNRMGVMAYGESNPVASNKTRAGRVQNRRVSIVVLQ